MKQQRDMKQDGQFVGQSDLMFRAEKLNKMYTTPNSTLHILKDMNLYVRAGEFIAITGSSGSGKTTLLSLLGALDTPDSGEIWLNDIAIHRLRGPAAADFRRQKIGFVFQLFYLLPNLTALENVMAPLLPYRRKLTFDLQQRAKSLLESVGLGDRLNHPPARLSGGEQQRIAIARALVNYPQIVLADEPTGNLDPDTGREVLNILRELQHSDSQTLIMVTHDLQLAGLADRQLRMDELQQA